MISRKQNLLDMYDIKARLIPASLCAVPVVVLYHYLLRAHLDSLFVDLSHVRLLGYVTIEIAITYAIMQLNNRLAGKLLQEVIFSGGRMPTTELLMPDDSTLSLAGKRDVVQKFRQDFKKDLPLFGRGMSDGERRQRIGELMVYIRNATRGDVLVKNHNIEYGFVRNLCGGAFAATLMCVASVLYFRIVAFDKEALLVFAVLSVLYGSIAALSKPLIMYFGKSYAKVLLEQYLCGNNDKT